MQRAIAVLVVATWAILWAALLWSPSAISWHFFADGAHALVHTSRLHVYADDPTLQIGPLTFVLTALVTWLPANAARVVAQVLMTAAGPLLVLWLAPLVAFERRTTRLLLAALAVVPAWTVLSVRWAHADDVLAMVFSVGVIRAVRSDHPVWAGLAIAAAIASKPWAIGFVPVLLVLERRRLTAFVTAGIATCAAWAPFLVTDVNTFRAFHPSIPISPDSGLHTLGERGTTVPAWVRTTQLLAAPAVALVAVVRNRWPGLFIAAITIRLVLDPQDLGYYAGAAAMAAVIFDLLATRWMIPWMTVVTVVVLWQPFVADFASVPSTTGWTHWWFTNPTTVGIVHLVWAVATITFVLLAPDRWLRTWIDDRDPNIDIDTTA